MTAPGPGVADLPDWPRWLSAELAAAYVGVSLNFFLAEVEQGLWPKATPRGKRRLTWDRRLLDQKSDLISNISRAGMSDATLIERARQLGNGAG